MEKGAHTLYIFFFNPKEKVLDIIIMKYGNLKILGAIYYGQTDLIRKM